MSADPLVSFIVLSYNYERYIGATLSSILRQTVSDLEVVVVDDASADGSCQVVRSFHDERVRLSVNDRNLGGAASYNRAIGLARGRFLVNLDADDWIDPRKTELQLAAFEADPSRDIIGTHVAFVDAEGAPHQRAPELEAITNTPVDLDLVDAWIGQNRLCRSSTMLRRSVHERIGLDEPRMVRAPDYELWTRALRHGCRFQVLPQPLTSLRIHAAGVTHGDPAGTFLEMAYLLGKNLVPLIEERAVHPSLARIFDWLVAHEQFARLLPAQRHRLLGFLLGLRAVEDYPAFQALLAPERSEPALEVGGRRCLALQLASPLHEEIERLRRDVQLFVEARDYHHQQSQNWEREARRFMGEGPRPAGGGLRARASRLRSALVGKLSRLVPGAQRGNRS